MIKIEKLSKYYGKKQILKAIDLEFKKGKVYGVVGENGAGKTTLFRCIAELESYEGKITSEYDNLKDHLGLLLTEPFFFAKITGKEYLQLLVSARGVLEPKIEEKNIFNLPLGQYASTYSTGMKKKLALTAVLLQENDVFILDEPFNGVDIQSNIMIVEIIKKLNSLGRTILVSSHIFSTLSEICDEIFLLQKGAISNRVEKQDFVALEAEMKEVTIGNRIDKLELK